MDQAQVLVPERGFAGVHGEALQLLGFGLELLPRQHPGCALPEDAQAGQQRGRHHQSVAEGETGLQSHGWELSISMRARTRLLRAFKLSGSAWTACSQSWMAPLMSPPS